VATRDRVALLERSLRSIEVARATATIATEVIVVDNGSSDGTAALLEQWVQGGPGRSRFLVEQSGKSRALNYALKKARASWLAFTDDDVEVAPHWVGAIAPFFAAHPHYLAAMGKVLVPPEITDPQLIARALRYGTLPFFDAGTVVQDVRELYGCNMVLHRQVFNAVGGFDERLGPGASGWGEDTELSERALRAGFRLGYMPEVVVYHTVDPRRLTLQFFRSYHRRKAQGDFEKDPRSVSRKNVSRLIDAVARFAWCIISGDTERGLRARMRMVRHAELLRLRWRAARSKTPRA